MGVSDGGPAVKKGVFKLVIEYSLEGTPATDYAVDSQIADWIAEGMLGNVIEKCEDFAIFIREYEVLTGGKIPEEAKG